MGKLSAVLTEPEGSELARMEWICPDCGDTVTALALEPSAALAEALHTYAADHRAELHEPEPASAPAAVRTSAYDLRRHLETVHDQVVRGWQYATMVQLHEDLHTEAGS